MSAHFTDYTATIRPRTSQTKVTTPLINESRGQVGSIPASYYKGAGLERRHGDWIFWRRLFMYFLSPYTQNRPVCIELRQGRALPKPSQFLIHWSPYYSNPWI